MDLFEQGMKGPTRPAPAIPNVAVNRYSPVTNWNDHPFGADVFEPVPYSQKKKPPPRPPPPNVSKQPEPSVKSTHFIRRPTVLSTLLSRRGKNVVNNPSEINQQNNFTNLNIEVDTTKIFPKCDKVNVQMGALIDLSSPPSSPTFTTRSSSDGVSVDSFGSDATTSTNHHNPLSGGNVSQAESGFEDDFDLFLHSRKPLNKDDTLDDFTNIDPFSAPPPNKSAIVKKSIFNSASYDTLSSTSSQYFALPLKGPTIIRAKPARPKPPDNIALLKSTFGNNFQTISMTVNTTTPIQKISNGFVDNVDSKPITWGDVESPEREPTPPMPTIPPPPPPIIDDDLPVIWPEDIQDLESPEISDEEEEPFAIALFDYYTDLQEDLNFSANSKISLVRRVNDEWLYGRLRSGAEGLFPSNYVEIKVPLPNEKPSNIGRAIALYDFNPVQLGDLRFKIGDKITILSKINEEWYFGDSNGIKGQFPINYVQMC